jgi:hypothetical protein
MLCLPLSSIRDWEDLNTLSPEVAEALTDLLEASNEASEGVSCNLPVAFSESSDDQGSGPLQNGFVSFGKGSWPVESQIRTLILYPPVRNVPIRCRRPDRYVRRTRRMRNSREQHLLALGGIGAATPISCGLAVLVEGATCCDYSVHASARPPSITTTLSAHCTADWRCEIKTTVIVPRSSCSA